MARDSRQRANDRQIEIYLTGYDFFWRLSKLYLIRNSLGERDKLVAVMCEAYGEGFFDYEQIVYKNLTHGVLADAVCEVVMLCEDYFGLLKFSREKYQFVKRIVSYDAGKVNNLAPYIASLSDSMARRVFFIPSEDFILEALGSQGGADSEEYKRLSYGLELLIRSHGDAVAFYKKYLDSYNKYKHGLKLCISGLGGDLPEAELQRRKRELSASWFVFDNKPLEKAAKAGVLMVPDVSCRDIAENAISLAKDMNLLRYEPTTRVDIDGLISIARDIVRCCVTLVGNRMELIKNDDQARVVVNVPLPDANGLKAARHTFLLASGLRAPGIDDYQIR